MRARLPKAIYRSLRRSMATGEELEPVVADATATAMKEWAIEMGATHYTHWFQPLTGTTAEKHDSFINPQGDGTVIMELSGKELIKGEPDASSFPSGGIRATFEARGYTVWDITSPAFIYDNGNTKTLCIPTAFCSYTGEALDKKTPLLRSMEAISKQAVRICRLFGDTQTQKVIASVGPEQEYFIVDRATYLKRKDLIFTGRTLFGAMPPKGQEMEDHYFGAIKERVSNYMRDLDVELWKLGIPAKTEHNEAAPAQHELAPIFNTANLATDENMLIMNVMKKVALRHGLVCLLHEKPFAGVNGSGKHNNWSLSTDSGKNLFSPGKTPRQNAQFLVFLAAFIQGIDEYQEFLRCTVASASNDTRLGANEAPPAIVSIFLGDELNAVVKSIIDGTNYTEPEKSLLRIGVDVMPAIPKDTTDRNRTSPLAFTGNKFELRMLGSSQSIAGPNIALNTIMAEELGRFADELEKAEDFEATLQKLVCKALTDHRRIIFDGNGYSEEWKQEAARRGLSNLPSTAEAMKAYLLPKNIELVTRHGVFTETEFRARHAIYLDDYRKKINIEARTMVDMAVQQILPAAMGYTDALCGGVASKKSLGVSCRGEMALIQKLSGACDAAYDCVERLKEALNRIPADEEQAADHCHGVIVPLMQELRTQADILEKNTAKAYWPYPTYSDLLFY